MADVAAPEQIAAAGPARRAADGFRAGSAIVTPAGVVPVERLQPGDRVLTVHGACRVVVQVTAHRLDNGARQRQPAWPVRIAAGAFGVGQPACDLFLAPDHTLFVDSVLVPLSRLVNGSTVRRMVPDGATYHAIALDRHAVVLANGLAAASCLRRGGPPGEAAEAVPCARLVRAGRLLSAIRRRLDIRAAALFFAVGRLSDRAAGDTGQT